MNGIEFQNRSLRQRLPEEWVALIECILPVSLRIAIANIIWWDFFGGRAVPERWSHLDDYLSVRVDNTIPRGKLLKALVALGYTEWQATGRIR